MEVKGGFPQYFVTLHDKQMFPTMGGRVLVPCLNFRLCCGDQERMHFNSFVGGVGRKDLSPVCNLTWLMLKVSVLQGLSYIFCSVVAHFCARLDPMPRLLRYIHWRKIGEHINLPFLFCNWGGEGVAVVLKQHHFWKAMLVYLAVLTKDIRFHEVGGGSSPWWKSYVNGRGWLNWKVPVPAIFLNTSACLLFVRWEYHYH